MLESEMPPDAQQGCYVPREDLSWRGVFDEAIPPLPIPPLIGEGAREGCCAKPRNDMAFSENLTALPDEQGQK